jgi:hypothetical protein
MAPIIFQLGLLSLFFQTTSPAVEEVKISL